MSICRICNQYNSVLIPDRSQPAVRTPIARQLASDTYDRFIYSWPLEDTGVCYYCTKKLDGRISEEEAPWS